MKNIGKITKFIAPAKFSSWRTWTDSIRPSAASSAAASSSTGSVASSCSGSNSTPSRPAISRNTSICSKDSVLPASSLKASSQPRGSGAVSSSRIMPISRS